MGSGISQDFNNNGTGCSEEQPASDQTEEKCPLDCFFRNPSIEHYRSIRKNDESLKKTLGKKYDIFLLEVRDKNTSFEEPLTQDEKSSLEADKQRLFADKACLNPEDLDMLWVLHYATGEKQYSEKVRLVSNDPAQNNIIRAAAGWSYLSHAETGRL